jgi:putative transcriptional regulator
MPIVVNLDVMMAKRRISSGDLAAIIGLSQANLSILKTGKARAIRKFGIRNSELNRL